MSGTLHPIRKMPVGVEIDPDGMFAVRVIGAKADPLRSIELRFADQVEAVGYADELALTWGNIFSRGADAIGGDT